MYFGRFDVTLYRSLLQFALLKRDLPFEFFLVPGRNALGDGHVRTG